MLKASPYLSQPITKKSHISGYNHDLSFYALDMQGWRCTMEDAMCYNITLPNNDSVFGIFDGHGGPAVARFVAKHFVFELTQNPNYQKGSYQKGLEETYKRIDQLLISPYGSQQLQQIRQKSVNDKENQKNKEGPIVLSTGCTANVVLITANAIYVANAGDSRAVLCKAGKAIPLSIDHKPTLQKQAKRVEKAGGKIQNGRVNGGVNLTRSIGDFAYKSDKLKSYDQQLVICKPDVTVINRSSQDDFIVMGCDGIWDAFGQNNQGLMDMVIQSLKITHSLQKTANYVFDKLLAPSAVPPQPGTDNMSMILIYLRKI